MAVNSILLHLFSILYSYYVSYSELPLAHCFLDPTHNPPPPQQESYLLSTLSKEWLAGWNIMINTIHIPRISYGSSLWVDTLNTIEYTPAVLIHFAFPLQLITKENKWELWTPVYVMEEETHQKRNHQPITTEEGEGGSGSHTNLHPGPIWKYN